MFKTKTENRLFYFLYFRNIWTPLSCQTWWQTPPRLQCPAWSPASRRLTRATPTALWWCRGVAEDCQGSRPTVPTSRTLWTQVSAPPAPFPCTLPPRLSPRRPPPVPRWASHRKTRQRNNWRWVDCGQCWTSQQHPVEPVRYRSERAEDSRGRLRTAASEVWEEMIESLIRNIFLMNINYWQLATPLNTNHVISTQL